MIALQKLLESHSLESSDLAEGLYYENAACIMERGDEAEVNRLLRVIATNKRLLAHGLEPLGCSTAPTPQPCALVGKAGLSAEEYEAIRGEGVPRLRAPLVQELLQLVVGGGGAQLHHPGRAGRRGRQAGSSLAAAGKWALRVGCAGARAWCCWPATRRIHACVRGGLRRLQDHTRSPCLHASSACLARPLLKARRTPRSMTAA